MNQLWPVVITLMGWVSYYWVGRHHWSGWALGIAAQTMWAVYAAETDQWAFVASSAGYIWLAILGWRNLHRKQQTEPSP